MDVVGEEWEQILYCVECDTWCPVFRTQESERGARLYMSEVCEER